MNVQALHGHRIVVGECIKCGEKRVLVDYQGDGFCNRCIESDDHLCEVIGWKRNL